MKRLLLIVLPLLLIVGCSKPKPKNKDSNKTLNEETEKINNDNVDYEKTNDEWFDYYNITDSYIMEKFSEIMKQEGINTTNEYESPNQYITNIDQLNYESITGWKRDGSQGEYFTPQYWSKISLYPNGKGKFLKGVRQNPWYPIQYMYEFDIVWFLQLSPSPMTVDKTWKPSEHIYDYLFYKLEDRTEREPLSFFTDKFSQEGKLELFSVINSVRNNFMSKNKYIINKNGYFIKNEDSWKDGKKNGVWKEWNQYSKYDNNCILESEVNYKNGELDGLSTEWNKSGQKILESFFINGKEISLVKWEYHPNGQKSLKENYKNRKLNGLWTSWYEDGQKEYEYTYKDGEKDGLWTRWYDNGVKWNEETYKDGKRDGLFTQWYENGQKRREDTYWTGGKLISCEWWNEDGSVKEPINFEITLFRNRNGLYYTKNTNIIYSGPVFSLYENGQKKEEGTFLGGHVDGLWTYWNENGQKVEEKTYLSGTLISNYKWEYGTSGKIIIQGNYIGGKEDGLWKFYWGNGNIFMSGVYKNGKRDGEWLSLYMDGQKKEYMNYINGVKDGKQIEWTESGRKLKEIDYMNGEMISEKCWDVHGNECDECDVRNKWVCD